MEYATGWRPGRSGWLRYVARSLECLADAGDDLGAQERAQQRQSHQGAYRSIGPADSATEDAHGPDLAPGEQPVTAAERATARLDDFTVQRCAGCRCARSLIPFTSSPPRWGEDESKVHGTAGCGIIPRPTPRSSRSVCSRFPG